MLITLNNGKTVRIPFEQYINMSDQEYEIFLEQNYGYEINDPFFDSQIQEEYPEISEDDILFDQIE